jgi:hypothetical protein
MAHVRKVIEEAFPGLTLVFGGRGGTMSPRIRTIHFRLRDAMGRFHSNVIWTMPDGIMSLTPEDIRRMVAESNGQKRRR